MRDLSATLLAKQKVYPMKDNLVKIVLTQGANTYTYKLAKGDRVIDIKYTEQPYNQVAEVLLDNADGTLTDLDFKGYKGVISGGYTTSGGDEYSDPAPLWVIGQQNVSLPGRLAVSLSLAGTFNLMGLDKASETYAPDSTNTDTVKTILTAIAQKTLTCYSHCTAYTITFDSEDPLIDSFIPKDSFKIHLNESRLSKMKELIRYTGCVMRVEDDEEIHVFVPTVSTSTAWVADTAYSVNDTVVPTVANEVEYRCTTAGTSHATTEPTWANATEVGDTISDGTVTWTVSYNYDYRLESTYHTFFSKSHRKRLVLPNYIVVQTPRGAATTYTGYAEDTASSDLIEKRYYKELPITSNAQGTLIATAMLKHYQMGAERGAGVVPMNVGAEVYDFNKFKDTRQVDYRVGNIGSITRHYASGVFEMSVRFGSVVETGGAGTIALLLSQIGEEEELEPEERPLTLSQIMPILESMMSLINAILGWIEWADAKFTAIQEWVIENVDITDGIRIPSTDVFYGDTLDGHLYEDDLNDYDATHDQVTASDYNITADTMTLGQYWSGVVYIINRCRLRFDTSAIPDDAIIIGATLSIYGQMDLSDTDFTIDIVDGTDLYVGSVSLDYGLLLPQTLAVGGINTSAFNVGAYNAITLTEAGLALINKSGYTKFGLRSSADIAAQAPTGDERIQFYSAERGSAYMPKLTIKYTSDLSELVEELEESSPIAYIGL